MSNLMAAMHTAGNALTVYQRALEVVQNNVSNSSTPGYAKQSLNLEALPFDLPGGLAGGVSGRTLESARNEYAEDEVRRQLQSSGFFDAQTQGSASVEAVFDVTGGSGVPASLNQLFQSFSAWSVTPGSADARQAVIAAAGGLAADVRTAATNLSKIADGLHSQIGSTVDQVNQLTATIQQFNAARRRQPDSDPGLDANVHSALEQLSNLVDTTTLTQSDGTITVLLNGGTPLVMGEDQYQLTAAPDGRILDSQGNDATAQIRGGELGGLLDVAGRMIPAQQDALNRFAQSFGDTVNGILGASSVAPNDSTPGTPLFTYDANVGAASFAVNPGATAATLAPVDASGIANGSALQLASLATSPAAGGIDGTTFGDFFSGMAASAGRESATAQQNSQVQKQVVAQTRTLRDHASGVDLDEQAVTLMQFQRSYQAAAKMVTTLNDMLGSVIDLIR